MVEKTVVAITTPPSSEPAIQWAYTELRRLQEQVNALQELVESHEEQLAKS